MAYLIDTNIISEIQKGSNADSNVMKWFDSIDENEAFLSVLVIGELKQGIEKLRRRNIKQAEALEYRLNAFEQIFQDRILPITIEIAEIWAINNVPDKLPVIDGLLAATALFHDLILVTRNTKDVKRSNVKLLNPFRTNL